MEALSLTVPAGKSVRDGQNCPSDVLLGFLVPRNLSVRSSLDPPAFRRALVPDPRWYFGAVLMLDDSFFLALRLPKTGSQFCSRPRNSSERIR